MSKPVCANCDGFGWVCENHPEVPWEGVAGYGCDCGAGMPCSCNDADPPWDFDSNSAVPSDHLGGDHGFVLTAILFVVGETIEHFTPEANGGSALRLHGRSAGTEWRMQMSTAALALTSNLSPPQRE